jgi:chromosome segregation ATPase
MRSVALFVLAASLNVGSAGLDSSPVSKVIKLLKDMQDQLRSDKKAEEEMYDKLSCWCKVNGDGKTEAVATAEAQINSLSSQMKVLTAKASELEMSIKTLEEEMAANSAALAKATSMREKEHAEFNSNEKDLILSIDSLKHALVVMEKSQEAFLQTNLRTVRSKVQDIVARTADDVLAQILTPTSRVTLNAFLQDPAHTPASGEIMGVLKQMRVEFAENLKDMQDAEAKAASEFEALDSAKSAEIAAAEKLVKEKTAQLGRTKVALADASEDHEDTTSALEADQAFLVDLKERCSQSDAEWEQRASTRAKEMQAVSEAIGILTDEDAHDLFHKSLSFLQLSSKRRVVSKAQRARESASRILLRSASKTGNRQLVQLAASARLDGFAAVSESIEGMISDLKKEQADEVKHKDYCNTEFHNNDMETLKNTELQKDLVTKIADLASAMETLDQEIAMLRASVSDATVEMQKANMNRRSQNQEFQQNVADQRATQVILKKAKDRLSEFYEFMQLHSRTHVAQPTTPGGETAPPPPGFNEYKSNSGAGSVLTMLQGIITDASEAEAEAITAENDAEAAYHDFLHESYNSMEESQRAITNKVEQKAKAESSKVSGGSDKDAAIADAEALAGTLQQLHASCDFVVSNFGARQAARTSEVEGLTNAMAALRTA